MGVTLEYRSFEELDAAALYELLALRQEVFLLEQRCIYRDLDGLDRFACHLLAREEGRLVGCVRLLPAELCYDGYAAPSFGRLAVRSSCRGRGIGGELVRRACGWLCRDGGEVRISAMAYLRGFYEELGFLPVSEVFWKEGVEHLTMQYRCPAGKTPRQDWQICTNFRSGS
ncbi:MAG: GNAT family N-acetyltransferase [Clostridiales bacterium]|nr:GNAT family N-acetyltransferase [Clostridiales bacterium]